MNRIGISAISTKELFRRLARIGLRFVAVLGAAALLLWMAGRGKEFLLHSPYFAVQTIIVEGVSKPVEHKIRGRMMENEMAQNILRLSVEQIQDDLLKIPELKRVNVQRVLPDALIIQASERIPAVMLSGENNYILDTDLFIIASADGKAFISSKLPILTIESQQGLEVGKKANTPGLAEAWAAICMLAQKSPDLHEKVAETHVSAKGEITLIFMGGKEVRLGRRNPVNVLPVLEAFWRETDAMDGIAYVELDYRNQAAFRRIRVPPAAAATNNSINESTNESANKNE